MRLGLLRCDEVGGDRGVRFGGYLDLFTNLFRQVDPDVSVTDYDVVAGRLPGSPDEQDGWIISGSRAHAFDEDPWVLSLLDLVVRLDRARAPTVGVCFGHQVMALALGGRVATAQDGWGIGVRRAEVVGVTSSTSGRPDGFSVAYSHMDQITSLPEGAVLVAEAAHCPVAAFTVGDHMLGIQGHPEFTTEFSADLYRSRSSLIGEDRVAEALQTLEGRADGVEVASWMLGFLAAAGPAGQAGASST